MTQVVRDILIVGGGTAGWLTAAILASKFQTANNEAISITLVESPNIPIVGVGEGTWPSIRSTIQNIGIDESEFMKFCDATFKQGTEFVNWMQPNKGKMHRYFHPLSAVFHAAYDLNLAPYWLMDKNPNKLPYDLAVSTQARVCAAGKAPKKITTPGFESIQNYAYHFNAHKFAEYLSNHCVNKLSVQHIKANVLSVNLEDTGWIKSVNTDHPQKSQIDADFFVDCSGSRALLIEGALGESWHSIRDYIFNDKALAVQIPYANENTPIATHTIATAHDCGWTWDIGLHNRRGVGYVYSSQHCSEEEARQTLAKYTGQSADEQNARLININPGYRNQYWKKNCVAIGMSAAFIEPLEASAIFLIDAAATMLASQLPRHKKLMDIASKQYNQTFALRWNKTLNFIKLHYCISDRQDHPYWLDNRREESIPESLQEKLELWQYQVPTKYDFEYAYEPFVLDSYLYVMYGMGFKTHLDDTEWRYERGKDARWMFDQVNKMSDQLIANLPSQRELVEKVYQYGFPRA